MFVLFIKQNNKSNERGFTVIYFVSLEVIQIVRTREPYNGNSTHTKYIFMVVNIIWMAPWDSSINGVHFFLVISYDLNHWDLVGKGVTATGWNLLKNSIIFQEFC